MRLKKNEEMGKLFAPSSPFSFSQGKKKVALNLLRANKRKGIQSKSW